MPFVHIRIAGLPLTGTQCLALQREVTGLMASIMLKKADVTAVLIEELDVRGWAIGGEPRTVAAHLEAEVTTGTNSAEEKASFVFAAAALLRKVLGPDLAPATYVVIKEIPAESWGYDGVTQETRKTAVSR